MLMCARLKVFPVVSAKDSAAVVFAPSLVSQIMQPAKNKNAATMSWPVSYLLFIWMALLGTLLK